MVLVNSEILKKIIFDTLISIQVSKESAVHVSESLVLTSLRGVDSHGVNLFPHYVRAVKAGRIEGIATPVVEQKSKSTMLMNAKHAFGHYAGAIAMDHAVEMAKTNGLGAVAVTQSTHFGAAAYFALRAAPRNCIGMAFTNADALVKAYNAKESFFGTNPICFAAPLADEEPYCLDMATSLVSWNKILNFRSAGLTIPTEWAFDANGNQTIDPNAATSLNPAGIYKGFDLGMVVDILCSLLGGGPVSKDILPMYSSPIEAKRNIGHFFMALDIASFTDPDIFKKNLQNLVHRIRNLEPVSQESPPMVAGDPEKMAHTVRIKKGIPIEEKRFQEFVEINSDFLEAIIA